MNKLLKKASAKIDTKESNKYEAFHLSENPFPTMPSVNESSTEKKYNGSIYEESIREEEYKKFANNFLKVPQNNPDHLRLGFLSEVSYIGRGNGKTSFLVNLMRIINKEYCLDISEGNNKCFSVYFSPEGGGTVKSFERFVDYFFNAIFKSNVINECLALLRYDALEELGWGKIKPEEEFTTSEDLVAKLSNAKWINDNVDHYKYDIGHKVIKNEYFTSLPQDFPLYKDIAILKEFISQEDFAIYYSNLKGEKAKLDFVFTHMVNFFLAAGFNGSFVLVDDFERIPDFQSAMQKKDFAIQLRTILYDGSYLNSRIGFYNIFIALHAGVPRLIQEAWSISGMEQRISIVMGAGGNAKHIINFEKINDKHAIKLVKKYLSEFRIDNSNSSELFPFEEKTITKIANLSEMNISKILQTANSVLEYAIDNKIEVINEKVVDAYFNTLGAGEVSDEPKTISNVTALDLKTKIQKK